MSFYRITKNINKISTTFNIYKKRVKVFKRDFISFYRKIDITFSFYICITKAAAQYYTNRTPVNHLIGKF